MGNEIALRRQSTCPMPSSPTEKLLPSGCSQSALNERSPALLNTASPRIETTRVDNDAKSAQDLAVRSFFRRNEAVPATSGINISKTGIISYNTSPDFLPACLKNLYLSVLSHEILQHENNEHADHHQQDVAAYLSALQQSQLPAAITHQFS